VKTDARDAADAAADGAEEVAETADRSVPFRLLARTGFAVLGIVHIVVGAIAISAATHAGGGEADPSGAMSQIARTNGGVLVLWLMVIALSALTLWQATQVVLVRDSRAAKRWGRRTSEAGKGIVYAFLAVTALVFALGGHRSSQRLTQSLSGWLLQAPGGAIVVALAGFIVFGIGVGFVVLGARRSFRRQLRMPAGHPGTIVTVVGAVGYIAKGVALDIVGVLFVIAAVTGDAQDAGGLDPALKSLRGLASGEVLLWIVGFGLIVYGVYCGIRVVLAKL
jgi:hypothetical protein